MSNANYLITPLQRRTDVEYPEYGAQMFHRTLAAGALVTLHGASGAVVLVTLSALCACNPGRGPNDFREGLLWQISATSQPTLIPFSPVLLALNAPRRSSTTTARALDFLATFLAPSLLPGPAFLFRRLFSFFFLPAPYLWSFLARRYWFLFLFWGDYGVCSARPLDLLVHLFPPLATIFYKCAQRC